MHLQSVSEPSETFSGCVVHRHYSVHASRVHHCEPEILFWRTLCCQEIYDPFFYLVMMFAPAPSPNPTTLEEKCFLRASRRSHLNLATLNWSRMVTRPIPIWCMVGKLKSLGRSLAPGSCPGITTCRKTDLIIGDRSNCFQIFFHLARMSVMLSSFKKVTQL